MLAPPPACHALVAPALRNGEPLEGQRELSSSCHNHARQGWRHLRAQSDAAPSLVFEIVKLLRYLLAGLSDVKRLILENRCVVFAEPVQPRHLAPFPKQPPLDLHVIRIKVSSAFRW